MKELQVFIDKNYFFNYQIFLLVLSQEIKVRKRDIQRVKDICSEYEEVLVKLLEIPDIASIIEGEMEKHKKGVI